MNENNLDLIEKPTIDLGAQRGEIDSVANCLDDIRATRRQVLKTGLAGLLAGLAPMAIASETEAGRSYAARRVAFRHAHTGETFSGVYRVGDKYLPDAFDRINYVLRDFRTGEVFPMDPRVIDILSMVHEKSGSKTKFEILSGYRSPKTNARLRRASSGVAKNSFHMYGQAIDIRLPDLRTSMLRKTARSLRAGGVGYYPKSNFVHVDTGKVRSW